MLFRRSVRTVIGKRSKLGTPTDTQQRGGRGAVACFGSSLVSLHCLVCPRAFQPQAVGFMMADDLFDPVSPTATSDNIGPKHSLGRPDSIYHFTKHAHMAA